MISQLDNILRVAIPMVYDESLSYVEFLAAMQAKVNELVTATNTFLSQDLQQYVIDQLEAWETDGTLADLINSAMQTEIDTLKGVDWTNQTVKGNADAITAIKGTGWTDETIKDNSDAINVLQADAARQYLDVIDYGAHAISESGYETFDSAAAIQDALDAGMNVFIPEGVYRLESPLELVGQRIRGAGKYKTRLIFYNCDAININVDYSEIRDLTIIEVSALGVNYPRASTGIYCKGTSGAHVNFIKLHDLMILGFDKAMRLDYTWNTQIHNVDTMYGKTSLYTFGQTVNNQVSDSRLVVDAAAGTNNVELSKDGSTVGEGLMISNCLIAYGDYGILAHGFLALTLDNCIIDLIDATALYLDAAVNFMISNSWIHSTGNAVWVLPIAGLTWISGQISGCTIQSTAGLKPIFIDYNNKGVRLINNTIKGVTVLVYIELLAEETIISGNHLLQTTPADGSISDYGTGSIIVGNSGHASMTAIASTPPQRRAVANNAGSPCCLGHWAAVPVAGTYKVGDYLLFLDPASAGFIGAVCTAAGTPGTWKTFGAVTE